MKKLLILIAVTAACLWAAPDTALKQHNAKVTETMDGGGYTYMKVTEGAETYWIAVTAVPVNVGQNVTFNEQMWMTNFKSRTLNRTFDKILFASMAEGPGMHQSVNQVKPDNAPKTVMKKADGGYSVAEVFAGRQALKGKQIKVRGKVTKVSRQIMKRNWIHLEDGTGSPMSDDLVFTSEGAVELKAGDVVVATGIVETDKDFGYGYFYPVILEKSSFVKER
jgi:hypothetical protein